MVQTRRQYGNWIEERAGRRHTDDSECESCASQASSHSQGFSFNGSQQGDDDGGMFNGVGGGANASYGPNDHCKRHRKPDDEPKNKQVQGYSRRTPRR